MSHIHSFLNRITMYRLMLYYLLFLWILTLVFSVFGILTYSALDILLSGTFFLLACYGANQLFAKISRAKTNSESQLITALILTLIVGPLPLLPFLLPLMVMAVVAMASKYLVATKTQHIFNPAAFAVLFTALVLNTGASWWIGSLALAPFLLLGGMLIILKIRRWHLVVSFLVTYFVLFVIFRLSQGATVVVSLQEFWRVLTYSPLLFFMTVMLVEPLTSPRTAGKRMYFGIFVAACLFAGQTFFANFPYSLESALLAGNLLNWLTLGNAVRACLKLQKKQEIAPGIWQFTFSRPEKFTYDAGQYLEWTLPHPHADSRGVRRYFTIASSPTEQELLLVTKIDPQKSSSYKQALLHLKPGDEIIASHLEGEFTLPKDRQQHIAFIAGGIGITPFRSHVKSLLDKGENRPITLLYSAKTHQEFIFTDLFKQAEKLGVTIQYTSADDSQGKKGVIDASMIVNAVPQCKECLFYVSGPQPMVEAMEKTLSQIGVPRNHIRRDYFPGYDDLH